MQDKDEKCAPIWELCTSLTRHNNKNENDERNNNIELLFDSFGFLQPDNQHGNQ
jgi:hypothetical protein